MSLKKPGVIVKEALEPTQSGFQTATNGGVAVTETKRRKRRGAGATNVQD